MKGLATALAATALLAAGASHGAPRCADLGLVLAVDTSASIDEAEFQLQVEGYAMAFLDPAIRRALREAGMVDVAAVFWADAGAPVAVIPWQRITSPEGAAQMAERLLRTRRETSGATDLGHGLTAALDLLETPGRCFWRAVVNVSGDGRASVPARRSTVVPLSAARSRAERMGVTVNALAIETTDAGLGAYYRTDLIAGVGSFVMTAHDFDDFAGAIARKLEREIRPQLSAALDGPSAGHP